MRKPFLFALFLVVACCGAAFAPWRPGSDFVLPVQGLVVGPRHCGEEGLPPCSLPQEEPRTPFSLKAWRVDTSAPNWSRTDVAVPKIEGKPRAEVIRLLGEPGETERDVAGHPDFDQRLDRYRLSARNTESLIVQYGPDNTAFVPKQSDLSCDCPYCHDVPDNATIELGRVQKTIDLERSYTVADIETLLGAGKLNFVRPHVAIRRYTVYWEIWHVLGRPYAYLMVRGHAPNDTLAKPTSRKEAAFFPGYTLITFYPDCLALDK